MDSENGAAHFFSCQTSGGIAEGLTIRTATFPCSTIDISYLSSLARCGVIAGNFAETTHKSTTTKKRRCMVTGAPVDYCAQSYNMSLYDLTGTIRKIQPNYFAYSQLTEIQMGE